MDDVERLAGGDAEPAALADRIAQDAVMAAQMPAVDMVDVARLGGFGPQLGDDVGIFALRHETDVLAVGLGGHRQPHALGRRAYLALGHAAEREAQEVDLLLRGGKEEIALVAVRIDRPAQGPVRAIGAAADVVPRRQRVGAQFAGGLQQVGELDRLVAGDARNRRLAGDVAFGEGVDHRLAKTLLVVEHVMGNAELLGNRARVADVLACAARARAMHRRAVVVKLQRDADDVVALFLHQSCDDGGIDAAGHGDDDPRVFGALVEIETVHRAAHASWLIGPDSRSGRSGSI